MNPSFLRFARIRSAALVLSALLAVSCVRTEFRYRDGGTDAFVPPAVDAATIDADIDAMPFDAGPLPDVGDVDAVVEDTGPVLTGDDATRAVLDSIGTRVVLPSLQR